MEGFTRRLWMLDLGMMIQWHDKCTDYIYVYWKRTKEEVGVKGRVEI